MSTIVTTRFLKIRISFGFLLILYLVITLTYASFSMENTTQIVTTRLTVTEKSSPESSKLTDASNSDSNSLDPGNTNTTKKVCSANLCNELCPGSYFKCDETETACVCSSSQTASTPNNSSCVRLVTANKEDWPESQFMTTEDVQACYITCRRVAEEVIFYGYSLRLNICDGAAINLPNATLTKNYCLCYFLNKKTYYSNYISDFRM